MSTMKELFSMIKDMDDQVKMMEDFTKSDVESHGFKFSITADLTRFTKEQIGEFTPEVIMNIRNQYGLNDSIEFTRDIRKDGEIVGTTEFKEDESTGTYDEEVNKIRTNLLEIYDGVKSFQSLLNDRNKIVKDVEKAIQDYSEYLSSDEVKKQDEERIKDLQSKIEAETDPSLKATYQKKLDIVLNSDSLTFIYQRMEKLGKKELDNIVDGFFNKKKFSYIIQRYEDKARRLGYKPELYKALIDIEEKFLGEDYYPFNNLFLFIMIRFIAYSDVNDETESLYCQSVIVKISKLMYHKFNNDSERDIVIALIKMVDDYFQEYKDLFQEKNEGNPLSSYRIELEKERREQSIENLKSMFYARKMSYDEDKSYEENLQYMHDVVEREQLINWFNIYNIEYSEDATLEELRALKDSINTKDEEAEEEVSSEETSVEEAGSTEVEDESAEELSDELPTEESVSE